MHLWGAPFCYKIRALNTCPVENIRLYHERVQHFRNGTKIAFFIGYGRAHVEVGKGAISNWVRKFLIDAGIKQNVPRGPHSVRSAATSAAYCSGIPIKTILEKGRWSNENTWQKHYNKNIVTKSTFQSKVLSQCVKQAEISTRAQVI